MRIIVIPDVQIKPGADLSYIRWISRYIVDKKPQILCILGDWGDMPSLSSYDIGTKAFEGRNYRDDILAANDGLQILMAPIQEEQEKLIKGHRTHWNLRKVALLGNHEERINVAINRDRKLDGLISTNDIFFAQWGFEVYPFLEVVIIEGIAFSHYFCSGVMGRPITTARSLLNKMHMSCIAGHQQGYDIATANRADGARLTGIIAGSAYPHDEGYLNAQTNQHWRGILMLNEVNGGTFDAMQVSLKFLEERYNRKVAA